MMKASRRGNRFLREALSPQPLCSRCTSTTTKLPSRLYSSVAAAAATPTTPLESPPNSTTTAIPTATSPAAPPYDVCSGLILTRPPLLTRALHPFENSFFFYQKRLEERLNTPFITSIYFKPDTPRLQDWNIKVAERGGTVAKELGLYKGKSSRAWDDELKIGQIEGGEDGASGEERLSSQENIVDSLLRDGEVRVSEDAEVIPLEDVVKLERPLPRRSEADEKNDKRRLDREMDRTLYLVVKGKDGWEFPSDKIQNENLHEAAKRILDEAAGVNMNTWIVGRVPVAHFVDQPVEGSDGTIQQRGQKTFLLKGRIMAGQADLKDNKLGYTDFQWVTSEELEKLLPEKIFHGAKNMMAIR